MMRLPLSKGYYAIVDDSDYEMLSKYSWHSSDGGNGFVYARGLVDRKHVRMHRLLTGATEGSMVDHINHNTLDNRRENLRICTRSLNNANQKKGKRRSSIYKGVSRYESHGHVTWRTSIQMNKKVILLGVFLDEQSAARAYNEAAKKYFGEYAYLNVI